MQPADSQEMLTKRDALIIGRATIGLVARNGAHLFDCGIGLVAADELFHADPYERIDSLRAALQDVDDILDRFTGSDMENRLRSLYPTIIALTAPPSDKHELAAALRELLDVHIGPKLNDEGPSYRAVKAARAALAKVSP